MEPDNSQGQGHTATYEQLMNFHLALAGFWFLLGMGLLLEYPNEVLIRGTSVSVGWVSLLISVYNLVRWYSKRANAQAQRTYEEDRRRRSRVESPRREVSPPEPDPNFDFGDAEGVGKQ